MKKLAAFVVIYALTMTLPSPMQADYITPPHGVVYKGTAPNGKCYIGQTADFAKRIKRHFQKSNCRLIKAAIAEYGDAIQWRIIGYAVNQAALDEAEKFAIAHYNTLTPNGYNLRMGGKGGGKPSAITRAKLSAAKIGKPGKSPSAKTRDKLSAANKGLIRSPATRKKIADSLRGRKRPPEVGAKIAAANRGRPLSPEHRAKLSVAGKGRVISKEQREKISASLVVAWAKRKASNDVDSRVRGNDGKRAG